MQHHAQMTHVEGASSGGRPRGVGRASALKDRRRSRGQEGDAHMAQEERAWLQPRQERRLRGKGCVMYVERETVTARGANPNNDTHKVPISHPHQNPGAICFSTLC